MNYVHQKIRTIDGKSFLFDLKFNIDSDNVIEFSHIGIHIIDEDQRVGPCINTDPHIITEGMCADGLDILVKDGVIIKA